MTIVLTWVTVWNVCIRPCSYHSRLFFFKYLFQKTATFIHSNTHYHLLKRCIINHLPTNRHNHKLHTTRRSNSLSPSLPLNPTIPLMRKREKQFSPVCFLLLFSPLVPLFCSLLLSLSHSACLWHGLESCFMAICLPIRSLSLPVFHPSTPQPCGRLNPITDTQLEKTLLK